MFFMDIDLQTTCKNLAPIIILVKNVIDIFKIGIPIILIVLGMVDLGKAVIANKEDEVKKAQGMLIKRAIYAVVVFFLVAIVQLVFGLLAGTGESSNWTACWNCSDSTCSNYTAP